MTPEPVYLGNLHTFRFDVRLGVFVMQVALQAGERERRKVMMELMESTLSPEAAPFSLDLGLDRIRPAAKRPEEEVHHLEPLGMQSSLNSVIAAPVCGCALIARHCLSGSQPGGTKLRFI